ncbi:hypothetical protein GLGCALEP_03159 [Pseudomonas sp. MM221]|nr:hypothetical protein DBADOPDK_03083 [Pseudomonas sp. MM223]CAI3803124.1 hypothetical protein GLGCALEP_03159 [Pseudomonas sp. MM221]
MRRERAARQPYFPASPQQLLGPLCGPFAAQGHSYIDPVYLSLHALNSRLTCCEAVFVRLHRRPRQLPFSSALLRAPIGLTSPTDRPLSEVAVQFAGLLREWCDQQRR